MNPQKMSRESIETLMVLSVIRDGCAAGDIAALLGLSPGLAPAVAAGIGPLVNAGWIAEEEERLSLTESGRLKLAAGLAAAGVA